MYICVGVYVYIEYVVSDLLYRMDVYVCVDVYVYDICVDVCVYDQKLYTRCIHIHPLKII